jgi:hypothetical protein
MLIAGAIVGDCIMRANGGFKNAQSNGTPGTEQAFLKKRVARARSTSVALTFFKGV